MKNFGFLLIAPQVLDSFPFAPDIKHLTIHELHFCSVPCGSQTPGRGSFSTCKGTVFLPLFPGIYPKPKASNEVYGSIALGPRGLYGIGSPEGGIRGGRISPPPNTP